jgi:hypothetical protein
MNDQVEEKKRREEGEAKSQIKECKQASAFCFAFYIQIRGWHVLHGQQEWGRSVS